MSCVGTDTVLGETDFRDVCRELVSIKGRYYQLGVELGVLPGELDAIKKEYAQDIDQAFNEVVLRWLRQRYDVARFGLPTWKRLIEAVRNPVGADNPALAMDIMAKHPEGTTCAKELRVVAKDSVTDTQIKLGDERNQHSLSARESMLCRNMVTIQAKFASLLLNVKIALEIKEVVVANVHQFLSSSPFNLDVSSCTEFSVMFNDLTKRKVWSYENYAPLEMLVEKFLHDNGNLCEEIKQYKSDLSGFLVATRLIEYIEENPFPDKELEEEEEEEEEDTVLPNLTKKQYRSLKVVLGLSTRKISDLSLMYVQELWEKFTEEFDIPLLTTVIKKIIIGSLEITWLVLREITEIIMQKSKTSKSVRFFRQQKIVSLTIDDIVVYEESEMMICEKQFFEVCSHVPTDVGKVSSLLELGVDPNIEHSNGETGLILACRNGQKAVAELLIDKGANVQYQDKGGFTALHWASLNGHFEVVKVLTEKGAWVDIPAKKRMCCSTALTLACFYGHKDIAELLIQKEANVNYQDKIGYTALHRASGNGYLDIVRMLTEEEARIDVPAEDEKTALSLACCHGHGAVAELLIQKGANVHHQDKVGFTALHWASKTGNFEVVKLLIENGAQIDVPTKIDMGITTALILASYFGHKDVAELLIQKGADLDYQDNLGFTALHWASKQGNFEVVKVLTEKGARIDIPAKEEENSQTAMILACINGHTAVAELLIQKGADVNYPDKNGFTPVQYANQNGHVEVELLLIESNAYNPPEDQSDMPQSHMTHLTIQRRRQDEVTPLRTFREVLNQTSEPDYGKHMETSDQSQYFDTSEHT